MADELDRYTGLAIDILFERKNHEDAIRNLPDCLDPFRTPRPYLRTDVVDNRNAERLHAARKAEIEIREIDDDQAVRTFRPRERDKLFHRRHVARQPADPFGK